MSFTRGDLITNGSSAGKVLGFERARGIDWVRIDNVSLSQYGGNRGMSQRVPVSTINGWRIVPQDWAPVTGGTLEERYVWSADYSHLVRELRKIGVTS